MNPLLHEDKKAVGRRSFMVAPSKHFSVPAPLLRAPLYETSAGNSIAALVTGLSLPVVRYEGRSVNQHHPGNCYHQFDHRWFHVDEHHLQQPDYTTIAARLQSLKYWAGEIPPEEVAEAGFYMTARPDIVRCHSCSVVIRNWEKGDNPIDIHCLLSPNCHFVRSCIQKLDGRDGGDMASPATGGVNHYLHSERPLIKGRVKKGPSAVHNVGGHINDNVSMNYPPGQQMFVHDCQAVKLGTESSSDGTFDSPPWEKMIFSERRLCEDNSTNAGQDEVIVRTVPTLMCKICHIKPVDHMFLPCGDAKACEDCATEIFNSGQPCYFCSKPVTAIHPIYL